MALFNFGQKPAKPAAPTQTTVPNPKALAEFAEMFKKLQEVNTAQQSSKPSLPNLDPKQLGELLSKTQMAPQISEAHIAAIQAGGPEALQTLNTLLNQTAQAAVLQSITAAQRLTQTGIDTALSASTTQLPQLVRDHLFQQSLAAALPNLQDPAVAPLVEVVRAGVAASNPTLTPEQLTEKAVQYFQGLSSVTAPQVSADQQTDEPAGTDYMALFNIAAPEAATNAAATQTAAPSQT